MQYYPDFVTTPIKAADFRSESLGILDLNCETEFPFIKKCSTCGDFQVCYKKWNPKQLK